MKIIAEFLIKNHLTLSVAESITSGNISQKITSVSESSLFYKGNITSYNTEIKENILNISDKIIKNKTVVSEEVAKEMAKDSATLFKTDISLSTTGVAGPNSDEFNNPVGLAYVRLCFKGETFVKKY